MRLIHYSKEPLRKLYSTTCQIEPDHYFAKPEGFWVSVEGEDGWREWCISADFFHKEYLQIENVIQLTPGANILYLSSPSQLDEFTKQYGVVGAFAKKYGDFPIRSLTIDWPRVAREYQGIVIAPYQWERRMDMFTSWYYCWDCASGCIWDVDAIESVVSNVAPPIEVEANETA